MIFIAIAVLVMGESGSGKSCSMRNFNSDEVGVFNVASKPLPFKSNLKKVDKANYNSIIKALSKPNLKTYVIDDSQYLMAFEMFDRAKETGYNKFTDIALNFKNLITFISTGVPDDVIVYFLHHVETTEQGRIKAKTSGKMIDNQLTLEGLFSIVLLANNEMNEYKFITQSNGFTTAKSPMGMFEAEIDNDLKKVDQIIREYYNLGGTE